MRDFAARKFLAEKPEAQTLYALAAPEPRFELRAAAGDKPAEILFYDEVGAWGISAKAFTSALANAGTGPITLRINSPGGDVFDGIAIHNAIKQRGGVTAVVDALAASAASFIMLAADSVTIQENAMVMVHKAWSMTVGNEDDHLEAAITLGKVDGTLAAMYAAKTGKPVEDMAAVMRATTWLTSSEAVAQGFVDSVIKAPAEHKAEAPASIMASDQQIARLKLMLRLAEAS